MKASYKHLTLQFKQPSGTSRGVMTKKESWLLKIEKNGKVGIGECGLLRSLSYDDRPEYEAQLQWVVEHIEEGKDWLWENLREWPSIQFGVEQAFLSLESENPFVLFPSAFTNGEVGMAINGLIWMGDPAFMKEQIDDRLASGFSCVKLKIGAIDFAKELELLRYIRANYSAKEIELRVDANGGFGLSDAFDKLVQLSELELHSIEQPIKKGYTDSMAELCKTTPLPIALDEELIGVTDLNYKENLLDEIKPQYIILKPSLVGGMKGSMEWITLAEERGIGWWITSALEGNIGLNAIAQWTYSLGVTLPQGLGTGSLYTNNIDCPLEVKNGALYYNTDKHWDIDLHKV